MNQTRLYGLKEGEEEEIEEDNLHILYIRMKSPIEYIHRLIIVFFFLIYLIRFLFWFENLFSSVTICGLSLFCFALFLLVFCYIDQSTTAF